MSKVWIIPEHEKDSDVVWDSFRRVPNSKQDTAQYTETGYDQDYLDEHWKELDE